MKKTWATVAARGFDRCFKLQHQICFGFGGGRRRGRVKGAAVMYCGGCDAAVGVCAGALEC